MFLKCFPDLYKNRTPALILLFLQEKSSVFALKLLLFLLFRLPASSGFSLLQTALFSEQARRSQTRKQFGEDWRA
jgi:hypothetical protein